MIPPTSPTRPASWSVALSLGILLSCAGTGPTRTEHEMSYDTPRARYEAWLGSRASGAGILAGPDLGNPEYQLFHVAGGPPGSKRHPAAASTTSVVVPGQPEGWGAFLRSAEPRVLQDQIGWMHGAWASQSPSRPPPAKIMEDPKVAKHLAEPSLDVRPDGGLTFEAFYGEPPSFDPMRFRVRVGADGGTTFTTHPVWKMP